MSLAIECLAEKGIRLHDNQQAQEFKALTQGITEVLPYTECKGLYQSKECQDVAKTKKPHGCVLKYYCKLKAEGAGKTC